MVRRAQMCAHCAADGFTAKGDVGGGKGSDEEESVAASAARSRLRFESNLEMLASQLPQCTPEKVKVSTNSALYWLPN